MSLVHEEQRVRPRYEVMEFGMLWRSNGQHSEPIASVVITNASLGGVQFQTAHPVEVDTEVVLELGGEKGSLFLPGDVRYVNNGVGNLHTCGFRFKPRTRRDRQDLARYVFSIRDRVVEASEAVW